MGVGLMAIWPTFPAFILALILSLLGNYIFIPSIQAYLGDRVLYQRRGQVTAITEFGWSFAFIFGVPVIGYVINRYGWQAPFPLLAGMGILAFIVLAFLLPEDPPLKPENPSVWSNLRMVLTYPPALAGILVGMTSCASNELINLVFGVWLENTFAVKIAALAAASAVIGTSELFGESLVSIFTDRLGKRLAIVLGLFANSLALLALPLLGRDLSSALLGLFFIYLTYEFTIVSVAPMMTAVLPSARVTLMASFIAGSAVGRSLGALAAPRLYQFGRTAVSLPAESLPGDNSTGLLVVVLAATALNLAALISLRGVRISETELNIQEYNG
jgi:predicted MFS family arabinose efflux permease